MTITLEFYVYRGKITEIIEFINQLRSSDDKKDPERKMVCYILL